jgi:FkbM family methyltransferase
MLYRLLTALAGVWPFIAGRDRFCRLLMRNPERLKRLIAESTDFVTTRGGFKIKLQRGDDFVSNSIRVFGNFEPETEAHILERVPDGGGFCDLGANVGYLALAVAAQRSGVRVLALEPNPVVADCIDASIRANAFRSEIEVHRLAVSDVTGTLPFVVEPEDTGYSRLASAGETANVVPIPVVRWDDWYYSLPQPPKIDCLKMDIEGVEVLALRGMERFLREVRPCLVVEAYDDRLQLYGTSLAEMRGFIESLGYRESRPWDGNVYYDPVR